MVAPKPVETQLLGVDVIGRAQVGASFPLDCSSALLDIVKTWVPQWSSAKVRWISFEVVSLASVWHLRDGTKSATQSILQMQRFSNRIRFFCFQHLSAKAALPGRLLSCAGGGGDADRAFAQLEPETGNFRVQSPVVFHVVRKAFHPIWWLWWLSGWRGGQLCGSCVVPIVCSCRSMPSQSRLGEWKI